MASSLNLRNGTQPFRSTCAPFTPSKLSLAEQAARCITNRIGNAATAAHPCHVVLPRHLYVEPVDLKKYYNDDPLVGSRGAAIILGISFDLLKQWRACGKGPQYFQYEEGGPVLYSVRVLNAFKAAHLITPRKGSK